MRARPEKMLSASPYGADHAPTWPFTRLCLGFGRAIGKPAAPVPHAAQQVFELEYPDNGRAKAAAIKLALISME